MFCHQVGLCIKDLFQLFTARSKAAANAMYNII